MSICIITAIFPLLIEAQHLVLTEVEEFGYNPGNLRLLHHVPFISDLDSSALVVVLHGCGQNARSVAKLTGWNKLADSLGFHVLYPQTRSLNNATRCFNWFSKEHNKRDNGEVRSIHSQVKYMMDSYPIDPEHVYVVGLSAGGAMAVAMLVCYPEVFAGGACVAGGPYGGADNAWESGELLTGSITKTKQEWADKVLEQNPDHVGNYPKLIISHGSSDPVVSVVNAEELVKQWVGINQLDLDAVSLDSSFRNNEMISRSSWNKNNDREMLVFYKIEGLGHKLSVDPGLRIDQGGRVGLFGKDIDFHSTYWIAKDLGLLSE